jgi:hypothetical protein
VTTWSPTSLFNRCIYGSENLSPTSQKDFCNKIGTKRTCPRSRRISALEVNGLGSDEARGLKTTRYNGLGGGTLVAVWITATSVPLTRGAGIALLGNVTDITTCMEREVSRRRRYGGATKLHGSQC